MVLGSKDGEESITGYGLIALWPNGLRQIGELYNGARRIPEQFGATTSDSSGTLPDP